MRETLPRYRATTGFSLNNRHAHVSTIAPNWLVLATAFVYKIALDHYIASLTEERISQCSRVYLLEGVREVAAESLGF